MAGFADKGMIRMIIRQRRGKQISALLLMTVILCCGCSNHSSWQKAKDRYVVGVVTKSNTSEYWMSVNSGMEAAAAKYDMDVITLAPDSELDREVQEKQVEKLIDQNVDALAVAPIDSYHVPDYLDEIEKKKITAVCFDNGMVGGELPYIGIDNHKTGYQLAQELAEQLHIEFLDRDIVDETAKRMNASIRQISDEEEGISSKFSYRMYPLGLGVPAVKDELFKVQQSIIQDFAKKESCIIAGRCGGYCLRNEKNLLKVYLYAPYEVRLKNCVERLGMTEKEAVKTISAVDKARESYHKRYIPGYQNATLDSDLCINTGSYTVEQVAALIQDAAKNKFGFDVVQG